MQKSNVMATYKRTPLGFVRGEGAWLFTAEDEAYLDFASGVAVTALGHNHPRLVKALQEQAERLWHTSNLFTIEGQEELASRLCQVSFAERVFFCNSGLEAVEGAVKTARKYHTAKGQGERFEIITFANAFHGRSLATLAAGGNEAHCEGFAPLPEGFVQVEGFALDKVKQAINDKSAGVLLEPIQGEGGVQVVPPAFLQQLRRLCDEAGLLLILDEVQCGMGRSGKLFAHEEAEITPDIMALAKALGGGFPLGAVLATEEASKAMTAGTHGSTYGGNPLAMAVGLEVLATITESGFLENVVKQSLRLKQKLAEVQDDYPDIIKEIRGAGLMLGLSCVVPQEDMVVALRDARLLSVGAGDNVVRLLPPLIIGEAEIDTALQALTTACQALRERSKK